MLVDVLNGTGDVGEAARVASSLSSDGFQVNSTADAASFAYTTSVIKYAPGYLADAEAVQDVVEGSTELSEDPTLSGRLVYLFVGSDCTGVSS